MRMWHVDLISYLPRLQLISQWREVCLIANEWAIYGTPNHILVNEVTKYPLSHFVSYCNMVLSEMKSRGYRIMPNTLNRLNGNIIKINDGRFAGGLIVSDTGIIRDYIYEDWHNSRYLLQCYFNLEEKHDRGGISEAEWALLEEFYAEIYDELL